MAIGFLLGCCKAMARRPGSGELGKRVRRFRSRFPRAITLARCVAVCLVPLLLGACVGDVHLSFLDPQGPVAARERWHFFWVLGIMLVLVVGPIFLALPLFVWHYRLGKKGSRYAPKWNYSRFLEIASWGGPIIIVIALGYFVWTDAHRLDPFKPLPSSQPALRVQVIGYDWKWLIIYPDQGIATIGTMAMPVGRPLAIQLTSATVMQSFFIPALGSQIYAMGGMVTKLNLEASHAGRFLGENTMYNGNGFHQQKFTAVAMTPDAFKAWVARVRTTGVPLDAKTFKAIARKDTRAQLVDDLPAAASHGGSVYLTDVSQKLFPAVVRSTTNGTTAALAYAAQAGVVPPATAQQPVPVREKDQ